MKRALFVGCGNNRRINVRYDDEPEHYSDDWDIVTVDINKSCNPTILQDMKVLHPFEYDIVLDPNNRKFDEINAYDSLEHWGALGDWKGWFDEMTAYHEMLKPGGIFRALVPIGEDALADPGHTRFFHLNHFRFLVKEFYENNSTKSISDYRWYIKRWWEISILQKYEDHHIAIMMVAA